MLNKIQSKAFTLIELLVVIAIIAILAAILFPVFAQARESARTTSCLNNEKQLTLAILQYVQDYDEKMPIFVYGLSPSDPRYGKRDESGGQYVDHNFGWDEACQPYIKNKQVEICPSSGFPGNDYNDPTKDDSGWTGSLNYAINCRLAARFTNPAGLAQLNYPAVTILLSEDGTQTSEGACRADSGWEWGWSGDQKASLVAEGADGAQPAPLARHKSGANYAFSDGHAKWYNAHALGLQPDGTATDTSVNNIMDFSGNHPTYHLNNSN